MKMHISMTAYRRPDYTKQVLEALSLCEGIEQCLFTAHVEPGVDEVIDIVKSFDSCPSTVHVNKTKNGLNKNTNNVLRKARLALKPMGKKERRVNLHIEDDTVLSPDALIMHWEAQQRWGGNPRVFSVTSWNKPKVEPASEVRYQLRIQQWFTCWGWSVSYGRLGEILTQWCFRNAKSFAWKVNKRTRKDRWEIHPQLSRVQNIGYEKGENNRTPEWYKSNHRVPWQADIPSGDYHLFVPKHHHMRGQI